MTASQARSALERWPRTPLGAGPTPLVRSDTLAVALGIPLGTVWLKLDDYTGFALGGNKVRKLETELAGDRLIGIDALITCGGPQSNHARVTAAAAAHLDLNCILVINGDPSISPTGNARLHRLLTPHIVSVSDREDREPTMLLEKAKLEAQGERALIIPIGASTGRGALGYALAVLELRKQIDAHPNWHGETIWVFVPTSSGGTLAGLLLGRAILGWDDLRIVAVSADDPPDDILRRVKNQARDGAALIGFERPVSIDALTVTDAFAGTGYGIPTVESVAATELWARRAGVLLDPVYTAKAAAGMVAWTRGGRIPTSDRVIFWHTGGQAALLA